MNVLNFGRSELCRLDISGLRLGIVASLIRRLTRRLLGYDGVKGNLSLGAFQWFGPGRRVRDAA